MQGDGIFVLVKKLWSPLTTYKIWRIGQIAGYFSHSMLL